MIKKKMYKYGKVILKLSACTIYDFLDKEASDGSIFGYDTQDKCFRETAKYEYDESYTQIIYSKNISYEVFMNSPEISIIILEKENEKNI